MKSIITERTLTILLTKVVVLKVSYLLAQLMPQFVEIIRHILKKKLHTNVSVVITSLIQQVVTFLTSRMLILRLQMVKNIRLLSKLLTVQTRKLLVVPIVLTINTQVMVMKKNSTKFSLKTKEELLSSSQQSQTTQVVHNQLV